MAQNSNKTSLSAGLVIRAMLLDNEDIAAKATKVFPVVTDTAKLPYILYRRASLETVPTKGIGHADTAQIEVLCFAERYADSIALAEAAREALDGQRGELDGLRLRSCFLADASEEWANDAFCQILTFNVKI